MSEESVMNPLVQRLAVGRLAAPGILDQRKSQRVQGGFAAASSSPVLDRLMRRVEVSAVRAGGLLLARGQSLPEADAESPGDSVIARSTSAGDSGAMVSHWTAPRANTGDLVARRPAGQRASGNGGRVSPQTTWATVAPQGTPSIMRAIGANGVVQRVADAGSFARDTQGAPPVGALAPMTLAPRVVMRRPETTARAGIHYAAGADAQQTGLHATATAGAHEPGGTHGAGDAHGAGGAYGADGAHGAGGARGAGGVHGAGGAHASGGGVHPAASFIWRKPSATESLVSHSVSARAAPSVAAVTATPLVFRKAAAMSPVFPAAGGTPSVASTITKVPTVVARTAAPPETTESALSWAQPREPQMNLERLTQQVSSRLARRLEIERERLGVRPWRQSSF